MTSRTSGLAKIANVERSKALGHRESRESAVDALGLIGVLIFSGVYLSGHPTITQSQRSRFACDLTDFLISTDLGALLGRIPRAAVTHVEIVDRTTIQKFQQSRYTLTRFALMGPLALAAPKRTTTTDASPEFVAVVEWVDNGLECRAQFKLTLRNEANQFLSFIATNRQRSSSISNQIETAGTFAPACIGNSPPPDTALAIDIAPAAIDPARSNVKSAATNVAEPSPPHIAIGISVVITIFFLTLYIGAQRKVATSPPPPPQLPSKPRISRNHLLAKFDPGQGLRYRPTKARLNALRIGVPRYSTAFVQDTLEWLLRALWASPYNPALLVVIPAAEWATLARSDRLAVVDAVENMVEDCRRNPDRYLADIPQTPFYAVARSKVSQMRSGYWVLATGPAVANDEHVYNKFLVVGDAFWTDTTYRMGARASMFRAGKR